MSVSKTTSNQAAIAEQNTNARKLHDGYKNIDRSKIFPKPFTDYLNSHQGLHILDAGGGSGLDALDLANKGHYVTVVDASTESLAIARTECAHPNIRYHHDLLPALASQEDKKFDAIMLNSVFHMLNPQDRAPALARLAQFLRPKGTLLVNYPSPPGADRTNQYEISPEEFLKIVATVNETLPPAQRLQLSCEPSVSQDQRKRKSADGRDVQFNKFVLESVGHAQTISNRDFNATYGYQRS